MSVTVKRVSAAASPVEHRTAALHVARSPGGVRWPLPSARIPACCARSTTPAVPAGPRPDTSAARHAGPARRSRSHTPAAIKLPIPAPLCNRPPPLPRAWSGHNSETIEAPVAHSEPIPTPTRNRKIAKDCQFQATALNPVVKRIGEDRQHHRPLAADIIGDDAADDASGRPAEHGRCQNIAGIAR